jgi:PIN domain nuclease of toxin-antitoxin system
LGGRPARADLKSARKLLNDPKNELVFSAASLWEVAFKSSLGREDFRAEPRLLRRGLHATSLLIRWNGERLQAGR